MRRTGWVAALLLAAMLAGCGGGGIPSNAVVEVGSSPITKAAFDHWMEVAAATSEPSSSGKPIVPVPPAYTACITHLVATSLKTKKGQAAPTATELKSECEQDYESLQQQVLGMLIQADWIIGEAESVGAKVSDAEVKDQLAKIVKEEFPKPGSFKQFLTKSHQTVSDLLLRVKYHTMLPQKIEAKVIKSKGTVTEAQVAKYYNENKAGYDISEKRSVEIILTKTEAQSKAAQKEIERGKSFSSVAEKVSIDPSGKSNGGLLPEVIKGQQQKPLNTAIFSTAKNILGGPVKVSFGYYLFEVKSITPGMRQSLSKVRATIKQQLSSTRQQAAVSTLVTQFNKKWTAKTDCRTGYVVPKCRQYKPLPAAKATPAPVQRIPVTPPAAPSSTPPPLNSKG
jgi:foldase protein PrsA